MLIAGYILCVITFGVLLLVAWNVIAWPSPGSASTNPVPRVSVLIPARNEAASLGACLDSVLGQGTPVAEVLVYDDYSTDGTAAIVTRYQAMDARIRLLEPHALPSGWCGKNFACARLAAAARSEWLLFLDADAVLQPGAVARMQKETETRGVTLVSCWPGFVMAGFWERLLMPMLNFLVFTMFPAPLSLVLWDASLGLAHGACIFVHRSAYVRVGGHEAVRAEIFEDTRIARVWRERGERGVCLDGQDVVQVRMYDSLRGIWRGFRKNFYPAFRHGFTFWLFLGFHAFVFLLPFAALPLIAAGVPGSGMVAGAALCILAARALLALRFRHPLWSVLGHPVAQIVLIALGVASWWRCTTGRGVDWKGRLYRARN